MIIYDEEANKSLSNITLLLSSSEISQLIVYLNELYDND